MTDKPHAQNHQRGAQHKPDKSHDAGAYPRASPAPTSKPKSHYRKYARKCGAAVLWSIKTLWRLICAAPRFFNRYAPLVAAFATIAIAVLTWKYVTYSKDQWQVAQDTLQVSQRAYVALGRKDGVLADFAIQAKGNAGIVLYFQNTGHLPAKFNWGTLFDLIVVPPRPDFPAIKSPHQFQTMARTRNLKDSSFGESGGQTIPGDSLFVADVAELPRERVDVLKEGTTLFMIHGAFEYCDALGNYSCRQFDLFYQGIPYNRFALGADLECPALLIKYKDDPAVEYLPRCETMEERARTQRTEQPKK